MGLAVESGEEKTWVSGLASDRKASLTKFRQRFLPHEGLRSVETRWTSLKIGTRADACGMRLFGAWSGSGLFFGFRRDLAK